jgi:hypothetical protein
VVWRNPVTPVSQLKRQLIYIGTPDTINNTCFTFVTIKHSTDLIQFVSSPFNPVNEIRPIKRAEQHFGII